MTERESIKVLRECIDLQSRKSQDYQNPNSTVKQAMHYRRGVDSIHDVLQGKMYRAQSLLESQRADSANFESLEDTYMDIINYASFAVSYIRGKMEGQDGTRDMFNKPKQLSTGIINPYGTVTGTNDIVREWPHGPNSASGSLPLGTVSVTSQGYPTIQPLNTKLDGRNG
jgi:hypothetical protein